MEWIFAAGEAQQEYPVVLSQGGRDCVPRSTDNPRSLQLLGMVGAPGLGGVGPSRGGWWRAHRWRNHPGAAGKAWQLSMGITRASPEPGAVAASGRCHRRARGWQRVCGEAAAGRGVGAAGGRSPRGRMRPAALPAGLGELCARRGKSHSRGLSAAGGPVSPSEMSPEPSGTAPGAGHGQGQTQELWSSRAAGRAEAVPDWARRCFELIPCGNYKIPKSRSSHGETGKRKK